MNLNEQINQYSKLQKKMEELKAEMDTAKASILEEMEKQGVAKTETPEGVTAQIVYKTNIKYSDEPSIIKFCEEQGYTNFVKKTVNTTALNKELKKGGILTESLNSYYDSVESKVLTVK